MTPFSGPDIPREYADQIMKAEASTPAAKDRQIRILLYALLCAVTFTLGGLNAFVGISSNPTEDSTPPLDPAMWNNNPILNFFLLNKIGGALSLILTGIGGTMIELEQRTKAENAEKIWNELQRRRVRDETSTAPSVSSASPKSKSSSSNRSNKKNKQNKKLLAFAEVLIDKKKETVQGLGEQRDDDDDDDDDAAVLSSNEAIRNSSSPGFFGKLKDFYNQADQLAASQALLLNKELEDRGILEKITDESGLKVVKRNSSDENRN